MYLNFVGEIIDIAGSIMFCISAAATLLARDIIFAGC